MRALPERVSKTACQKSYARIRDASLLPSCRRSHTTIGLHVSGSAGAIAPLHSAATLFGCWIASPKQEPAHQRFALPSLVPITSRPAGCRHRRSSICLRKRPPQRPSGVSGRRPATRISSGRVFRDVLGWRHLASAALAHAARRRFLGEMPERVGKARVPGRRASDDGIRPTSGILGLMGGGAKVAAVLPSVTETPQRRV